MKDTYLIDYLVRNGYSREDVSSSSFNIDSLEEDFTIPIDLSSVENFEELGVFLGVHVPFLVTQMDIDSGRVYELSKMLCDFEFIGVEPDMKLDKLSIFKGDIVTVRGDDIRQYSKHIVLRNFNLDGLELDGVDEELQVKGVKLGDSFSENREKFIPDTLPRGYGVVIQDCNGLDMSIFNGISNAVNIIGGRDIRCSGSLKIENLVVRDYNDNMNFLTNIKTNRARFENLDKFDLMYLEGLGIEHEDFGYGDMNLLDIKKCYASKDIDIPNNIIFRNVNFLGERSFNIQTPLVDFQSCEGNRSDSLPSFNVKDGRVNGCNFEMALHVDAEKSLSVTECFDVDRRVEALVDRNGVNGFFFSYEDLTGYDMRKTLGTLDLSIPENQDLLEDSVKLKEVFADNKYIKNIIVNERMSEEVKDILGKYAPNINYSYTTDLSGIYGFNENLEEHVNFEKFMDGERVFDSIVAGMDENLSELEKFKYIYNELGKLVSYDINVLRDKNEDIDSYNRANLTARNLFSSVLSGKGVCAVYADMYMYVCKKAGLSCKREGGANHAYNVIQYIGNDGELVSSYCDLTLDSSRIKGNLNCRWFGKSVKSFVGHVGMTFEDAKDISEEAVMAIDKKLGYEYKRKLYLDVVREALELDGKEERVGFLLENMMQVQDISSMDNHEVMKLVLLVLGSCEMDPKDFGVTSAFIRRDMRQDKDVRDILWVRDKDENENERYLYYTFNSLQQRFKSLDYDVVDELLAAGMMEFYKGQKLPGFENWISEKEYKERRTSNMEH